MNRREAAAAIVALFAVPARLLAMPPAPAMRVRIVLPRGSQDLRFAAVLCERTGHDLSHQFPVAIAHRLRRSFETQRPVRVSLFRLRDGRHYLDGDRIAREMATVLVTSIE